MQLKTAPTVNWANNPYCEDVPASENHLGSAQHCANMQTDLCLHGRLATVTNQAESNLMLNRSNNYAPMSSIFGRWVDNLNNWK